MPKQASLPEKRQRMQYCYDCTKTTKLRRDGAGKRGPCPHCGSCNTKRL